jgi:hypothetical protein
LKGHNLQIEKRNLTLFLIFGIALSCAGLYLAFRRVPFAALAAGLTFMDYFCIAPVPYDGKTLIVNRDP